MRQPNLNLISELSISDMKAIVDYSKECAEWLEQEISKASRKRKNSLIFKKDSETKKRIRQYDRALEALEKEFSKYELLVSVTQHCLNNAIENLYESD